MFEDSVRIFYFSSVIGTLLCLNIVVTKEQRKHMMNNDVFQAFLKHLHIGGYICTKSSLFMNNSVMWDVIFERRTIYYFQI